MIREHELKVTQDERRHELELQRRKEAERRHELDLARHRERERRAAGGHRQHLVGVAAGMIVSLTCIGGATWFGVAGHYCPIGILVGPVLLALTKMFVLRKSDARDISAAAGAMGRLLGVNLQRAAELNDVPPRRRSQGAGLASCRS